MKFQVLPFVALLAAQAYAACGPDETELFDLQVTTGTSQCSNFGCFKSCTFPDGSGSCNGCTQSVSNDHIRPLGGSYCCKGPLTGQTNTCVLVARRIKKLIGPYVRLGLQVMAS
ncbi:hypothetical protein BDP55DRAFT_722080 [Colletotrichum godetiae]|uniref:Uncharacterized protein n=1 Tax=Colletotrichum godetiae TaxID=1209918 RepID=A0AAJ0A4W3_9PEZI|nr:uncharacterized protein BDP55DRAFT_722080 [Colletotrichum godetiae]KAK1656559.1 hypothetical protein BDP55DRAFT_722080 [Colletotrichum godetiae]